MAEPGFEIRGVFYPMPSSYRVCDPVVVAEVTGMTWNEFADALDDDDPRALPGLLAVAVWQKNPSWRRDKVVSFLQRVDLDEIVWPEPEGPEDDAGPPAETASPSPIQGSPETSIISSDGQVLSAETPSPIGHRT